MATNGLKDEEITVNKKIVAGAIALIVFFGVLLMSYDYYQRELTWKRIVEDVASLRMQWEHKEDQVRDNLGDVIDYVPTGYVDELIFLLRESGFETYNVNAFALNGFCIIESDFNLTLKEKARIFDECLKPVNYVKVIAVDGDYYINAWTGEYVPKTLSKGERKAIVVKNEYT